MDLGTGLTEWLNDQIESVAGIDAVYERGATQIAITVVPGQTLFSVSAPTGGARVIWGDADFLFPKSELGDLGVPRKGDKVRVTLNGETCDFEASTPTGETVWRYSDPHETQIRLHTKRVA